MYVQRNIYIKKTRSYHSSLHFNYINKYMLLNMKILCVAGNDAEIK